MIPKTKHFDWIEDYCSGQLNGSMKLEFESELKHNAELQEEVKFEMNLQAAIKENDVLILREKLKTISARISQNNHKNSFDLLEGFADIQELTNAVPPEELLNFYDSLPKAHIYQHEKYSNENIHQFYREQDYYLSELGESENIDNNFILEEFEGLGEAIHEKDIMNLRNTLSQVAKTVKLQYTTGDIDDYLNGELLNPKLRLFEEEMEKNRLLKQEVEIHRELERAVNELDIRSLRKEIAQIMDTETSWNVSAKNIEKFIDGELDENLLEEFKAEYEKNTDLKAEVTFRKNVDAAISENDVFSLRNKLKDINEETYNKEIKSILPETNIPNIGWLKKGVAVALITIALAGVIRREFSSIDKTYEKFYKEAQWSPERAVVSDLNYLQQANIYQLQGNYEKAIEMYDEAIRVVDEKYPYQFWKATLLQDLEKYNEAIPEYSKVIKQGDNVFIEEAEWNKSLCYVKLGKKELAKQQLFAIIERKGFYEKDAKALLRSLRFTFR